MSRVETRQRNKEVNIAQRGARYTLLGVIIAALALLLTFLLVDKPTFTVRNAIISAYAYEHIQTYDDIEASVYRSVIMDVFNDVDIYASYIGFLAIENTGKSTALDVKLFSKDDVLIAEFKPLPVGRLLLVPTSVKVLPSSQDALAISDDGLKNLISTYDLEPAYITFRSADIPFLPLPNGRIKPMSATTMLNVGVNLREDAATVQEELTEDMLDIRRFRVVGQ